MLDKNLGLNLSYARKDLILLNSSIVDCRQYYFYIIFVLRETFPYMCRNILHNCNTMVQAHVDERPPFPAMEETSES